jgi:hypothetical protein
MTVGLLATISLGSYLSLATNQSRSVMRSLAWNAALPLAEAGIEEGLAHAEGTSLSSDGWTVSGSTYTKQRTLGDGYYVVTITNSSGPMTITSTGYALWQGSTYVARSVQVTAQGTPPIFQSIGLATTGVTFGGSFTADSYNSANPLYSTATNLASYDPAKDTDQAVVSISPPGVNFGMGGSSKVLGYAAVPPWATVTASGNSSMGSKTYNTKGIQAGHASYTFTNTIPDVVVPSYLPSANAPSAGTVNGAAYNYVLNGNYNAPSLDAGGSSTTIYVQGNSKLYVAGNVTVSQIVFAPGATLDLYIATPSLNFSPVISGALPPQFSVWATPTCTSMTINGGTAFVGFIYGPEVNLNAGGNAAIYGAITAKTFACNGTFDLHYDCSRTNNPTGGSFKILSWAEL